LSDTLAYSGKVFKHSLERGRKTNRDYNIIILALVSTKLALDSILNNIL